jgi:pimeloyl-ACP methyl ester carboxylesterase
MKHLTFLVFLLISVNSYSQNYLGTWKGEVLHGGSIITFEMNVMMQRDTTIGATLFKPTTCLLTDSSFYGNSFHLKSPNRTESFAEKRNITFTGELSADKNQLDGIIAIAGTEYPLQMRRSDQVVLRPQEPKGPFPYYTEDVKFINQKDQTVIAGTLTKPHKEGIFPAIILKGGSNPVNRDGESNYHKLFLVLADYLTRNGIAVLRCDDRGIGRSTGSFFKSTPADLASDLLAGYEYLASRKDIKSNEIGLIGHSEGGLVIAIAASQNPNINFVVMLAAPGIPIVEVFEQQTLLKYQNGDISKATFEQANKIDAKINELLKQNMGSNAISDSLNRMMDKDMMTLLDSLKEVNPESRYELEIYIQVLISSASSPHALFNLNVNPSNYIEKLSCPVLSLNGSKDILVSAEINQEAIRRALMKAENKDFKIIELPDLNHTFQECLTGSLKEYLTIEQTISPEVLDIITHWIKDHVSTE